MKNKRIELALKVLYGDYEKAWINRSKLGIWKGETGYAMTITIYTVELFQKIKEGKRKENLIKKCNDLLAKSNQTADEWIKFITILEKVAKV